MTDFIVLGSKSTADGDCSHEIKKRLLLGRKAMTNVDSVLKSRDIALPTKVHAVKAMVSPISSVQLLSRVQLFVTPWTVAPGFSVHGILQARILEWTAIPFSRGSS